MNSNPEYLDNYKEILKAFFEINATEDITKEQRKCLNEKIVEWNICCCDATNVEEELRKELASVINEKEKLKIEEHKKLESENNVGFIELEKKVYKETETPEESQLYEEELVDSEKIMRANYYHKERKKEKQLQTEEEKKRIEEEEAVKEKETKTYVTDIETEEVRCLEEDLKRSEEKAGIVVGSIIFSLLPLLSSIFFYIKHSHTIIAVICWFILLCLIILSIGVFTIAISKREIKTSLIIGFTLLLSGLILFQSFHADGWVEEGIALENQRKYEEAIKCFDKALAIDSRSTDAWNNKGYVLNELGKYEEAIKCFDKVLEIDPKDTYIWKKKGLTLSIHSKYEEAIKCFDKVLEIDPKDKDTWNKKGYVLNKLGKYEEAINCFDKVLEIDPRNESAWNKKGLILATHSKYEESIKCFDRLLAINPRNKSAWNIKGYSLNKLGKYEEAIKCFDRLLFFFPNSINAKVQREKALKALSEKNDNL